MRGMSDVVIMSHIINFHFININRLGVAKNCKANKDAINIIR